MSAQEWGVFRLDTGEQVGVGTTENRDSAEEDVAAWLRDGFDVDLRCRDTTDWRPAPDPAVRAESTGGLSAEERATLERARGLQPYLNDAVAHMIAARDAEHARHEAAEVARVRAEERERVERAIENAALDRGECAVSERERSLQARAEGNDRRADVAMNHAHALRNQRDGLWDARGIVQDLAREADGEADRG